MGEPSSCDALYDDAATLCETRVVLLRARSFDEAINKAEREAEKYAGQDHPRNRYGQEVVQTYLGHCDVFELVNDPGPSTEVFSRTEVIDSSVADDELIERRMGPSDDPGEAWRRNKFLAAEFSLRLRSDA